jgi:hypothetical protein
MSTIPLFSGPSVTKTPYGTPLERPLSYLASLLFCLAPAVFGHRCFEKLPLFLGD